MKHTFLLTQGRWSASGVYTDEEGVTTPAEAELTITHLGDLWLNEGSMTVQGDTTAVMTNRYEIVPLAKGALTTTWKSTNPAIGVLYGIFSIVGDSILSAFCSDDGSYSGMEYLRQVSTDAYENRGIMLHEGMRVSSWEMDLTKRD
ncbi:MAG TPA: hypothetical protein PLR71_11295 [Deltaproteobacteria bacterium]|nr:hypothetical protein [Deltaproteobacteria bacterium]HQI82128.1 hypothetical protein [Deltaproteobacteria bacterium]